MKLTRSDLHALVWTEPMQRLAKRFGISDVALAKRCRRLNIPVPGRGYWARKGAGQRVHVVALPKLRAGEADAVIVFAERSPVEEPVEIHEGPVWEQEQFEARSENRIEVRSALSRHPLIRATSAALREHQRPFPAPILPARDGVLDVSVSRSQITRALCFLDAFVRACEGRGFAVRGTKGDDRESKVSVHGRSIEFRLRETDRRIDLQKEAKARGERSGEHLYTRYRYEKTGLFEFHIGHRHSYERRAWRDGKTQRVEDVLNDAIVALVDIAVSLNAREAEHQREEAERFRRAQLKYVETVQRENEQRRVEQLIADTENWVRAERLRAFLNAIEIELLTRSSDAPPMDVTAWLAWANYVADDLDPLLLADPVEFLSREPPPTSGTSFSERHR